MTYKRTRTQIARTREYKAEQVTSVWLPPRFSRATAGRCSHARIVDGGDILLFIFIYINYKYRHKAGGTFPRTPLTITLHI